MFRQLLFVIIASLSMAQISCVTGKTYVKITMKCATYCYEQGVKILDGTSIVYQNEAYIDNQDSVVESCIDTSSTGLYTLELSDNYGDGWTDNSYVTLTGKNGNVFFKNWMTETSSSFNTPCTQTFSLSLHYPIDVNAEWKVKNNAQGDWTSASYSDSDWTTETLGSATGSYYGTQYFRKQFTGVSDMAAYEVRMNYRYGIVAYISGEEVFRDNMPAGAVTSDTAASSQYSDVSMRGFLRPGKEIAQNGVLAVELHFLSGFTQQNVDFNAFLSVMGTSVKDHKCIPYPYTVDVTSESTSTVSSVSSVFDWNTQSSLSYFYLSTSNLVLKYSMNAAVSPLINDMMLWAKFTSSNPRTGSVSGSMDGSSYSSVIAFSSFDNTPKSFAHAFGYWGGNTYKYYRLTVTTGTDSDLYLYEMMPSVCNLQAPTSISFPETSYTYYKNLEDVLIEPTIYGFSQCTIQPALPQGLTLDADTCTISGIATEASAQTTYTVTSAVSTPSISGTLVMTINECSGSVIRLLRTYQYSASAEAFSIIDPSNEEVLFSVEISSGQPSNMDWSTLLCVSIDRIGVDVSSSNNYWYVNSYLYIQTMLDSTTPETLLRARFDNNLGIEPSFFVHVGLPVDTYEQWFYRNQGDVPTNWYDSNTSGWSTGSRDNFGQFTKRVELYKKTFTLSTLEDISGFTVSIRYRYGVAVYVNSVEVFKNGITTVSDTAVVDNIYPSLTFHTVSLPLKTMAMDGTPAATYLQSGTNTIAIALVANGDTTRDSTFDAALALLGSEEYSRVFDYTTMTSGSASVSTDPFTHYYYAGVYGTQCTDNSITISFNNDRREWISSILIQSAYDAANYYVRQMAVLGKNQADEEWTLLGNYTNMGWSLVGQTKKLWLKNNKSYNQYMFQNMRTMISDCTWRLSRIDMYTDNLAVTIPDLQYVESPVFKDIEMGESYPTSNMYRDFTITPALPNGLNLCTGTGMIYGTATEGSPQTAYTISANKANGDPTSYVMNLSVDVCTGGRGLITAKMRSDGYPDEGSWKLFQGRGNQGTLLASLDMLPVANALVYMDRCLDDGIYTFAAYDSFGDGWLIPGGIMMTVDVGATIFEVRGFPDGGTPPTSVSIVFSSFLPFQITYSDWMVAKVEQPPEGWTAIAYSGSEFVSMKAADIGSSSYVTTYIRKTFSLPDLDDYQVLNVRVRYNGGVIAYFNGKKVARFNMADDYTYTTTSLSSHDASAFSSFHIILLTTGGVVGQNVIAFEVHNPPDSASTVVFDATGIFGVEECSLLLDTYSEITGSSLVSTSDKYSNLFDYDLLTYSSIYTETDTYIDFTIENQEGTTFNAYGLLTTISTNGMGFSLMGRADPEDTLLNFVSSVNTNLVGRQIARFDSPINFISFRYFHWQIESTPYTSTTSIQSFLFYYCKASGDACPSDGDYPSVGEGQMSPALCSYGYKGFQYRVCSGGVLGEVHSENCTYLVPQNLLYPKSRYDFVLDMKIADQKPTYDYIITRFSIDPALPAGLTLNAETGVISGTPTEVYTDTKAFTLRGDNPVGAVTTTLYISVKVGRCAPIDDFLETEVGTTATYDCAQKGSYVGTLSRDCVLTANGPEWVNSRGVCISVVTIVILIVVAILIIAVIVFVLLRVTRQKKAVGGVRGKKSAKQMKSTKSTGKATTPKAEKKVKV